MEKDLMLREVSPLKLMLQCLPWLMTVPKALRDKEARVDKL